MLIIPNKHAVMKALPFFLMFFLISALPANATWYQCLGICTLRSGATSCSSNTYCGVGTYCSGTSVCTNGGSQRCVTGNCAICGSCDGGGSCEPYSCGQSVAGCTSPKVCDGQDTGASHCNSPSSSAGSTCYCDAMCTSPLTCINYICTAPDTCTYSGSGNWYIKISDNCTISSANTVTGNIYIYGANGRLTFSANQKAHAYYYNVSSGGAWFYNNYKWLY